MAATGDSGAGASAHEPVLTAAKGGGGGESDDDDVRSSDGGGSEPSATPKRTMGDEIFALSDDGGDDDDDDAVEDAGATSARGAKKKSAGATDDAPSAATAGFAFGEQTVKAAAQIDAAKDDGGSGNAVKDDGAGDNAGADVMSEQSPPGGEELVARPSEQSERAEAEEAKSSSDSAPKIGIVQELPAPKDGVEYVLENARVFTWSKPAILGNLTVEHYTTINKSSKGHVRAGVPKMHKQLDTIKLNERYRAFPENLLGNVKCLGILRMEKGTVKNLIAVQALPDDLRVTSNDGSATEGKVRFHTIRNPCFNNRALTIFGFLLGRCTTQNLTQ